MGRRSVKTLIKISVKPILFLSQIQQLRVYTCVRKFNIAKVYIYADRLAKCMNLFNNYFVCANKIWLFMVYQVDISQDILMCQSLEMLSQRNVCSLGDGKAWASSTDGGEEWYRGALNTRTVDDPWRPRQKGREKGSWWKVPGSEWRKVPRLRPQEGGLWGEVLESEYLMQLSLPTITLHSSGRAASPRMPAKPNDVVSAGGWEIIQGILAWSQVPQKELWSLSKNFAFDTGKAVSKCKTGNEMNTSVLLEQSLGQRCGIEAGGKCVMCGRKSLRETEAWTPWGHWGDADAFSSD